MSKNQDINVDALIKERVERAGSARAYAEHLGISPAYLNDIIHGRRAAGVRVLDDLGLERRTEIVRVRRSA